jgi:hypothetical protein
LAIAGAFIGILFRASPCSEPIGGLDPASRGMAAESSPSKRAPASRVDTAQVRRLYLSGDFDEAIALLEANLKEPRTYRHEDSVFIFKHLGVMYAAQYDTREKGTYFMHRLLQVEPTAKILDMYASDMIYMIFKNIQEEYEQNRMQLTSRYPDSKGPAERVPEGSAPSPAGSEPATKGTNKKAWIWTGAAVAAVAAGVGAYYLIASESKPDVQAHAISE